MHEGNEDCERFHPLAELKYKKDNAEEFFCEPPISWKTTGTAQYRHGGILCSGED